MSQKQRLVSFSIVILILLLGIFILSQLQVPEALPLFPKNTQNVTTSMTSQIVTFDTGRPCKSNEEWHQKADQTGAWIDGVLVDPKISDTEILKILGSYNISTSKLRFLTPHYIGYYIEEPESQYKQIQRIIDGDQMGINLSFTSPMYVFTNTSVKRQTGLITVPVMISYSSQMNETMTYQDVLNRGIPVRKAKVIEMDLGSTHSLSFREGLLLDLANNDRILFTYKGYYEGVLC